MRSLRILIASPHVLPRHRGGVEVLTAQAAEWLAAHGHEVAVAAIDDPHAPDQRLTERTDKGYVVHRLRFEAGKAPLGLLHDRPRVSAWIDGLLAEFKPDVVHVQSGYLMATAVLEAARRRRVPSVLQLHDFWFLCSRVLLTRPSGLACSGPAPAKCAWCLASDRRTMRWADQSTDGRFSDAVTTLLSSRMARTLGVFAAESRRRSRRNAAVLRTLGLADAVLATSARQRQRFQAEPHMGPAHIGLHLTGLAARPPVPKREPAAGAPLRVGYLGQVASHKGVHVLAAAARDLPDRVALQIHGDPKSRPKYVRRLKGILGRVASPLRRGLQPR